MSKRTKSKEWQPSEADIGARIAWKIAQKFDLHDWEHEWMEEGRNWLTVKAAWAAEMREIADLKRYAKAVAS